MPYKYEPGFHSAPFDPERCAASVRGGGRSLNYYQCSRKPRKDGWCKQHHPESEKKRREERTKRWEKKRGNSPWMKLDRANEKVNSLLAACVKTEKALCSLANDTSDWLAAQVAQNEASNLRAVIAEVKGK